MMALVDPATPKADRGGAHCEGTQGIGGVPGTHALKLHGVGAETTRSGR
jgi:hypothetical protein